MDYISLTLDIEDGSGNLPGRTCSASFVPSAVLTDAGVAITDQAPVSVVFNGIAAPTARLLATDNAGPQPPGWTWGVTFGGTGLPGPFSFFLPAGADTFTATDAAPCVFTLAATDAPFAGTGVQLSGDSLPAGFEAATTYYVVSPSGSSYSLAATLADALAGTALASTSTGSGSVATVSQVMSNLIPVSSGTSFQAYLPVPSGTPSAGQVPVATGTGEASAWGAGGGGGGSGTVTSVSVASANGFAGTVANPTTTPAITVRTSVTGLLKGNGTSVSAASAGTDYLAPSGNGSALTGITATQVGADASGDAAAAQSAAEAASTPAVMTTLGDIIYENATPAAARLAGNASATKKYLTQTGTGSVSAAPAWGTIAPADLPAATTSAQGAVELDGTAGDIAALGAQAAGSTGKAADAGHVHPTTGVVLASSLPLSLANGGTGTDAGSANAAYSALSPMTTTGDIEYESSAGVASRLAGPASATKQLLTSTGTGSAATAPAWGTLASADIPNNAANTSGTAAALSAASALPSGTTAATQSGGGSSTKVATDAFVAAAVAAVVQSVAAGDTSIVVGGSATAPTIETGTLDVIAADHPPAANWSNNSHKITSVANGSGAQDAAAYGQTPAGGNTAAIAQGGTGQTSASAAFSALSPMTTLGDTVYGGSSGTGTRLAGITSGTKNFLTQTGTGSASAAPAWGTIASGDVPTLNQNTSGSSGSCSGNAATATNLAGGATLPDYLAPAVAGLTFVGAGTTLVNAALGNAFNLTLTASTTTLGNPSNPVDGQTVRFRITQGSGGSFTLAYGSAYDFGTAGSPTLSTTAAKVDILAFEYVGSISKWCFLGAGLGY